jgi:uncharacterized membrane protein
MCGRLLQLQVLDEAMPMSGASHALQALHKLMRSGINLHDFAATLVHLAFDWACALDVPCFVVRGLKYAPPS